MTDEAEQQAQDFWGRYDEDRDETEGGGGVIARGEILTGYQVFPGGKGEKPTFFPAVMGDEAGRKVAIEKAREIGRPQWGVLIRVFKDSAYKVGDDGFELVTWAENREEFQSKWVDAFKEVLQPALVACGIALDKPWTGYFRLGWCPDPHFEKMGEEGKQETYNDKPVFKMMMFPLEIYASVDEATAAVEGGVSSNGSGKTVPEQWEGDEKSWKEEVATVKGKVGKAKGKRLTTLVTKFVAELYGNEGDPTGEEELGATAAEMLDWLTD